MLLGYVLPASPVDSFVANGSKSEGRLSQAKASRISLKTMISWPALNSRKAANIRPSPN